MFCAIWLLSLLFLSAASAHHVLGRPSYSLGDESNTPPSMQVETQIGKFYVTYMVFPAFPQPNQAGRVNLYASRISNGEPYQGKVTFKVRDDSWFSSNEETLGTQDVDDNVFRQGFIFKRAGDYIITAEFQADGEPYTIDFPLQIGDTSSVTPVVVTVIVLIVFLLGVSVVQRKRLLREKIRTAHNEAAR
jgi:hypothetical protein